MDKVAILCPIAQVVFPDTFQSALALVGYSAAHGIAVSHVGVTERTLIETARNMLAEQFLKTDADWAFWIDSDMEWPKDTLVQLLQTAKEKNTKMVTGIYYQRGGKHWPVLWVRDPSLENGKKAVHDNPTAYAQNEYLGTYALPGPGRTSPFKVHAAGFGCTLIHRSVFEKMAPPFFDAIRGVCSEDFYFFVNAQKQGFDLWANPIPELVHQGNIQKITKDACYKTLDEQATQLEQIKS